jgi:hypothetical protein
MSSNQQSDVKSKANAENRSSKPAFKHSHPGDHQTILSSGMIQQAEDRPALLDSVNMSRLQRNIGNQAVLKYLNRSQTANKRQVSRSLIHRHALTAPKSLAPVPIQQDKKVTWNVSDVLSDEELKNLKKALLTFIPADADPPPQKRVDDLAFIDHQDPMSMPGGAENKGNAAKVTDTGEVHFNNTLNDYYNPDGSYNANKIKSTIVHEAFHAVSANHTGLQSYSDLIKAGSVQNSPDEAITEYFSLQVYKTVFGKEDKDYTTGYWVATSETGALAPNPETRDVLNAQQLPAGWSGQMVDILKKVLGVDDDGLKKVYFKNPDQFGNMIIGKQDQIKKEWGLLMGKQSFETHQVVTKDYKAQLLDETINEKAGDLKDKDEAERIKIIKSALTEKKVPKVEAKMGAPYSDKDITKRIGELVK